MLDVHDPVALLTDRLRAAITAAFPEVRDADPLIAPTRQSQMGDFQSNAAMPLAKRLGQKPRDVAAAIIARLDISDIAEPVNEQSIAGPGFINIRMRSDTLAALLSGLDSPVLGLEPAVEPQIVVVDLCGVNLAKQMHVGHLRSTIIGDTLARVLARLGHQIIRQNHVGDWGLPIAMVTSRIARSAALGKIDLDRISLDDLDRLYKEAQRECDADVRGLAMVQRFGLGPKAEAELEEQVAGANEAIALARQTLLKLQAHDPGTVALWRRIADITMDACISTVARLNAIVLAEHSAGESSYAEELSSLVADLLERGIAEESDGALVVRLEDDGITEPCIIRKRDGGYLYATTDMAAIRRRVQNLGADRVIYAVDARQSLHFRQVFAAARKAGYATRPTADHPSLLEHAAFGTVLGEDGRPFKTRSGENVKLADLIDEAIARAEAVVAEKNPSLGPEERRRIAEAVGIAALRYADQATDRIKDYIFSFDRMLAFEGNTGVYLINALVRIRSIFRKAAERAVGDDWKNSDYRVEDPAEKSLALALLKFPGAVQSVGQTLEPHRLCQFLYELAGAFSVFYDACPVLNADEPGQRAARLRLCDLTARVLHDGLNMLGIPTLDRM